MRTRFLVVIVSCIPTALLGCGPGAVAGSVRPEPPKVQESLCDSVSDFGQPLIVDLKAHERAVYEAVMNDGVAVVRYDCAELRLIKDCRLDGNYGFIGLSPKEEVVQLRGEDEIRINLPSFGAKLATEVSRDSSLDLGMLMIGMRRTTVSQADSQRLAGTGCEQATHFVRGAFVGAFALRQGSAGRVSGALDILGAGVGARSASSKRTENRDGDPDSCKKVDTSSATPDSRCSALLRLELTALDAAEKETSGPVDVCPKDLVLVEGKCAPPSASAPFQCREGQLSECEQQCVKGHAGSCAAAGFMYFGAHGVSANAEKAATLSELACQAGVARGCNNLGHAYERGDALPKDMARARNLYDQACQGGFARGCTNLGVLTEADAGPPPANPLFERGCEGGDARGCHYFALNVDRGAGVAKDPARAKALFERACHGKYEDACALLSSQLLAGTEEERAKGAKQLEASCQSGTVSACRHLAAVRLAGTALPYDPGKAVVHLERACEANSPDSCSDVAALLIAGRRGLERNPERGAKLAKRACDANHAPGCRLFAAAQLQGAGAPRDDAQALRLLEKSCTDGDGESCAAAGLLHREGSGTARSPALATGMFEKACNARYGYGCALLAAARYDGLAGQRDDAGVRAALSRACAFRYQRACGLSRVAPTFYTVEEGDFEGKKTTAPASAPPKLSAGGSPSNFARKRTGALQDVRDASALGRFGNLLGSSAAPSALAKRREDLTKRIKARVAAIRACPRNDRIYNRTNSVRFTVGADGKTTVVQRSSSGHEKFDACLARALGQVSLGKSEYTIDAAALVVMSPKGKPSIDLRIAPDPSEFRLPPAVRRLVSCACSSVQADAVCAIECRQGGVAGGEAGVAASVVPSTPKGTAPATRKVTAPMAPPKRNLPLQ